MSAFRFAAATLAGLVAAAGAVTYSQVIDPDGAVASGLERISAISPITDSPQQPSELPLDEAPPGTGTVDPEEAEEAEQAEEAEEAKETEPEKQLWDDLSAAEVLTIQQLLVKADALDAAPNGVYGPATQQAVRQFQAKHGLPVTGFAGPLTLAKLKGLNKSGSTIDPRCQVAGKVICIDKSGRVLRALQNGKVVYTADARFGTAGMATREGQHRISFKSRDHVSSIYKTAMPFALFFSGGQAVHYSADFAAKGYAGASHGCVNLRSKETARKLFEWAEVGTPVVVYRSA